MTNFLYNPDRKGKAQLIAEFVVRTNFLEEVMHDLETSSMKTPEQHYLLVGQRGSGKTTLLNRIKYAVEDSGNLNSWLIPVIFSEEQYNMSELANLWESVGQVLEDYHGFEDIAVKIDKEVASANFEESAYEILEAELKKKGKKLLLLIDNIGDFLKKLDDKEIRRLREILQSRPYLRIIAGSPFYLESLLDYKQPFFEFFKVLRLDGLSKVETESLLRKLGEVYEAQDKINFIIEKTPERVETLRILTGGVPRTIALMFRIFIENEHNNSINDLEKILDAVTPLYKHRMDDLPTQQQKIVDAVAKHWDPITVKELKGRVRMESKIVSAQLRQMEKDQVIEKRESGSKNHYYLLRERFFNIWYLMRYGRKFDRQRVIWLVRFLESWCSNSDIEQRVLSFIEEIKEKKLTPENIDFFGTVYTSIQNLTLRAKAGLKQVVPPPIRSQIDLTDEELTKLAEEAVNKESFLEALTWLSELKNMTETHKRTVVRIMAKATKKISWNVLGSKLIESWLDEGILSKSQVFVILIGLLVQTPMLNDQPEQIRTRLEFSLFMIEVCREDDDTQQHVLGIEARMLVLFLSEMYKASLINSAIEAFENASRGVPLKVFFEPIYFALLILAGKMDYSQLPGEKVELIRNIASEITKK